MSRIRIADGFVLHRIVWALVVYSVALALRFILGGPEVTQGPIVTLIISVVIGAGIVVLPSIMPTLGAVLLLLAGRTALPAMWTGLFDVSSLLIVGFLALAVSHVLLWTRNRSSFRITIHPVLIIAASFPILYLLQFAFSTPTDYAIEKVYRVSVICFAMMIVYAAVFMDVNRRKWFMHFYLLVVGAMSFMALAVAIIQNGLLNIQRLSPIGGGPITLGRFTGFAALICLIMFFGYGGRRYLLAFVWFAGITLFNGSRGPLLAMVLTVALFMIASAAYKSNWNRWFKVTAFLGVAGIFGGILFMSALAAELPAAMRYVVLFRDAGGGSSVSARTDLLQDAQQISSRFPFWGGGVASFEYLTSMRPVFIYPHNLVAELLVENGAFGLTVFVSVLVIGVILGALTLVGTSDKATFAYVSIGISLLVFTMINAQFSGDIYDNRYVWPALGWLIAISATRPPTSRNLSPLSLSRPNLPGN